MLDIKTAQRVLMLNFLVVAGVCLLMVLLYETEMLLPGMLPVDSTAVFLLQVVMEVVSIVVIPVALKMFALSAVRRRLVAGKGTALLRWGTARINLLCLPMLVDTFMYYQTMWPGFGYLAIILLLCLCFVYPSLSRCEQETREK